MAELPLARIGERTSEELGQLFRAANHPKELVTVELMLKPYDLSVLLERVSEGVTKRRPHTDAHP
ncbi:MAG: hypothetical protein JST54_00195 [Deltaproteobacteria bacterium]|nr:hypothetical protein [Deltaproteobacteria bacterium]